MTTHPQHPENMSNDDIIAIARSIREEDNSQLRVRTWKSSRRRIAWYIALPAACVVSFIFGYCLRPTPHADTPHDLTARAKKNRRVSPRRQHPLRPLGSKSQHA